MSVNGPVNYVIFTSHIENVEGNGMLTVWFSKKQVGWLYCQMFMGLCYKVPPSKVL